MVFGHLPPYFTGLWVIDSKNSQREILTLSRPSGTLGFGILRRPTSCIHAVVSRKRERVIR
jgi:hypothetical protein